MNAPTVTTLSPERAEKRRVNVGASEVAALFGLHPYLTAFELWHQKAGKLPVDDLGGNARVEAGIFMESGIAAWVKHRTGWPLVKVERYCEHPTIAGMGASPDYEYLDAGTGERVTVQVKNVDGIVFRSWEDGPPMVYQLQVQHEIACGGYKRGVLAVCIGGNDLELFHYDRHESAVSRIEAAVAEFWKSIHAGLPPDPDFGRDLETLRTLYAATTGGKVVDLSSGGHGPEGHEVRAASFVDACRRYDAARAAESEAEKAKKAAQAEILTLIEDAAVAVGDGCKVSTWPVAAGEVSYTRSAYRGMKISILSAQGPKKARKK